MESRISHSHVSRKRTGIDEYCGQESKRKKVSTSSQMFVEKHPASSSNFSRKRQYCIREPAHKRKASYSPDNLYPGDNKRRKAENVVKPVKNQWLPRRYQGSQSEGLHPVAPYDSRQNFSQKRKQIKLFYEKIDFAWVQMRTNHHREALEAFNELLSQAKDLNKNEKIFNILLGKARSLQGCKRFKEAEEIFRALRLQVNEEKRKRNDDFSGNMQIELGLACCLDSTGDVSRLKEAETIFRALRHQKNQMTGNMKTDVLIGNLDIEIGLARCLQKTGNARKLKNAEEIFRTLRHHVNKRNGMPETDVFSGSRRIELGLACCLDITGDGKKRGEAETIFRALRSQENKKEGNRNTDVFCGYQQIELGLAFCLGSAGNTNKLKEAEKIFRDLRRQENKTRGKREADVFSGHLQIELGLATSLDLSGDTNSVKEAEKIFRFLRRQENKERGEQETDVFSGSLKIELGLASCLDTSGNTNKAKEAEEIFLALRRQENKRRGKRDTDVFSGHLQIELGLATSLDLSGDTNKVKDAEKIFRALRCQENEKREKPESGVISEHRQIELGLATCLSKTGDAKKGEEAEEIFLYLQENKKRERQETNVRRGQLQTGSGLATCLDHTDKKQSKPTHSRSKSTRIRTERKKMGAANESQLPTRIKKMVTAQKRKDTSIRHIFPFKQLSWEMREYIGQFLDFKSAINLQSTCKSLRRDNTFLKLSLDRYFVGRSYDDLNKLFIMGCERYKNIRLTANLKHFKKILKESKPLRTAALILNLAYCKAFPYPSFFKAMKPSGIGINVTILETALLANEQVAVSYSDGTMSIWDLTASKDQSLVKTFSVQTAPVWRDAVRSIVQLSNGWIVTGSYDGNLQVWDPNKDPEYACIRTLKARNNEANKGSVKVTKLSDLRFVSFTCDEILNIWDLKKLPNTPLVKKIVIKTIDSYRVENVLPFSETCIAIKKQKGEGLDQCVFEIYNLSNTPAGAERRFRISNWKSPDVLTDGRVMACVSTKIYLWNPGGTAQNPLTESAQPPLQTSNSKEGHSEKNKLPVSFKKLYPRIPSDQLHIMKGHTNTVMVVTELKNNVVASASRDHTARVWDLKQPGYPCIASIWHRDYISAFEQLSSELVITTIFHSGNLAVWEPITSPLASGIDSQGRIVNSQDCIIASTNEKTRFWKYRGCSSNGKVLFMKSSERNADLVVWDLYGSP